MTWALIWKEGRELKSVLAVGLLWLVLVSCALKAMEWDPSQPPWALIISIQWLGVATLFGLTSMAGATAFACEKEEKTDLFLDSLAASRGRIWAAKLVSRVLAVIFVYLCILLPIFYLSILIPHSVYYWEEGKFLQFLWTPRLLCMLIDALGVSFMASMLLSNSLEAMGTGVVLSIISCIKLMVGNSDQYTFLERLLLSDRNIFLTHGLLAVYSLGLSFWLYVLRPAQKIGTRRAWSIGWIVGALVIAVMVVLCGLTPLLQR